MPKHKQITKQSNMCKSTPQASVAAAVQASHGRLDKKRAALFLAVILMVTVLVYAPTFQNGFTNWDDDKNVYENKYIPELSLTNLKVYFTKPLIGMYTPLVYLSFALDYRIKGFDPAVYHGTNLLLHLINAALIFWTILLITETWEAAAIVTLIFAVHPLNTGAVAPVSVRSTLLYALFYLGAFIAYVHYIKDGKYEGKYLLGAGMLFVLSLLSKSAAVVFPLLMLLTDYYYHRRMDQKAVLEKLPFFALALFFGVLTLIFRADARHMFSSYSFTPFDKIFLIAYSLVFYVVKLVLPIKLSAFYPYPSKTGMLLPWEYYLALPALLVMIWGILTARKYRRFVICGALFFLINIVLVLKIIPMGNEIVCDRYAYLPSLGLLTAAVCIFYREKNNIFRGRPQVSKVLWLLALVYVILLAGASYDRNKVWKNNFTLYSDIIRQYQNVPEAFNNRGIAYWRRNANKEALADFNKAVALDSSSADYFSNRGNVKKNMGDYRGAWQDFDQALSLDAGSVSAYCGRGNLKMSLKDYAGALLDYTSAITASPGYAQAYYGRASVQVIRQDYDAALADYSKAIELDPYRGGQVYYQRAYVYMIKGNLDAALQDYNKAIQLNPRHVDALLNRGYIRYRKQDATGAIADYTKVIQLAPVHHDAYQNRGLIKWVLHDEAGACADWIMAGRLGNKEAKEKVADYCRQ